MVTSTTRNTALIATVFFMLSVVLFVGVYSQIQKMGLILQKQMTVVANNSAREQEYNALSKLIQNSEPERSKLDEFVLTEADAISFLTDIEQLARNRGILLSTKDLRTEEKPGQMFSDLRISFEVEGTMAQLKEMIKVMEALPYHGSIDRVALSRKEGEVDDYEGNITVRLSLNTETHD